MNYISDFVPLSMGGSLLEFLPVFFATDENAVPLPESAVRQETENGRDFLIYSSDT